MFTDIRETPRSRFLRAYRAAGWGALALVLSIIAFSLTIAAFRRYMPEVTSEQNLALVLLVLWAAYLGGRLARAPAHRADELGAAVVSCGEALVKVAAALEREEAALRSLTDLDVSERSAATAMLTQAKGATMRILDLTAGKPSGSLYVEIRDLATRVNENVTDAIEELACVQYHDADQAVDEAAAAVKH